MNKINTNRDQLVMLSAVGVISDPPLNIASPYRISADGKPMILPGTGGISYNARIGDSAIDIWADHVEPAVSIKHPDSERTSPFNGGLVVMSCVGNTATVVSGDAKGETGRVTGKHGGVFHVMVDFTRDQMDRLVVGDKIQIKTYGQGLVLTDFPGVMAQNLDPALLDVLNIVGNEKTGRVEIPITHLIPAACMGSGLGASHSTSGDYDIQMFDENTVEKHRLDELRFGDIVAITNADNSFGRIYRKKSISVGVIVHSRSVVAGHGPGVTTLFTSRDGLIDAVIDPEANLKNYFEKL